MIDQWPSADLWLIDRSVDRLIGWCPRSCPHTRAHVRTRPAPGSGSWGQGCCRTRCTRWPAAPAAVAAIPAYPRAHSRPPAAFVSSDGAWAPRFPSPRRPSYPTFWMLLLLLLAHRRRHRLPFDRGLPRGRAAPWPFGRVTLWREVIQNQGGDRGCAISVGGHSCVREVVGYALRTARPLKKRAPRKKKNNPKK